MPAIFKNDPQAIEKIKEKIAGLEKRQAQFKLINKAVKKKDNEALKKLGYSEMTIQKLYTPDFAGRVGIPSYELTNNNANIRRLKERLVQVEREQAREEVPETEVKGATIRDNVERGSTEILFGEKPHSWVLERLHLHGWRYAPSTKTWYKQRRDDFVLREAKAIIEYLEPVYEEVDLLISS